MISPSLPYRQQGIVLIVSLLILVMMTIIGITALSTTTLEERMALNTQHDNLVFQGTESQIQSVINASTPGMPGYSVTTDPMLTAMAAGANSTVSAGSSTTHIPGGNATATLDTNATITYLNVIKGAHCKSGGGLNQFVCYQFQIDAAATINTSGAKQEHLQGVQRIGPAG